MAGERRLNWGADATDAKWRSEHDTANSKFILAEDLDGGTILLEYDETASEFVSRGPVNLDGNDVTGVGALDATSVSTKESSTTEESWQPAGSRTTLSDDGSWSWFQGPRAIRYNGSADKTYLGYATTSGDVKITSYDHADGSTTTTTLQAGLQKDGHISPGIIVLSDGTVAAFYSAHNGGTIYYRLSSASEDISSFGTEQTIAPSSAHTYMVPYQTTSGRLYLFYRNATDHLAYVYSDDSGSTWSSETELINGSTYPVYFQFDFDGSDRFDIALSEAGHSDGAHRDARHVYFQGGTVYDAAGNSLGTPPIDYDNTPAVYDTATGKSAWVWDCHFNGGNPEIVYATFEQFESTAADVHHYRYARWNGASWDDNHITEAGSFITQGYLSEDYYSAGIALTEAEGECFLAIGDHSGSQIQKWRTPDHGQSWQYQRYFGESRQNVRPVVPENAHEDLPVLWMHGTYNEFVRMQLNTQIIHGHDATVGRTASPMRWGGTKALYTASGQSIPGDNTLTTVELDFLREDIRDEFDDANNQIVIDKPGYYIVTASVGYTSFSAAGTLKSFIAVDGNERVIFQNRDVASGEAPSDSGSTARHFERGSKISLMTQQNSGSSQTTNGDNYYCSLSVHQIPTS